MKIIRIPYDDFPYAISCCGNSKWVEPSKMCSYCFQDFPEELIKKRAFLNQMYNL